ncbi:MAG TPA: ABC transporter permease subunit [Phycisphaerae bacterium]
MRNVGTLARRELSVYFLSPIAYVVMAVFLLVAGIFWVFFGGREGFAPGAEASLRGLFGNGLMLIVLVVLIPLVTMRLLSEEFRSGTIEKLMTAPVTESDVVLGKFAAAMVFYLALLASTLLYVVLIRIYGQPDWGLMLSIYLGLILIGALYAAVGVFFSALTRNQVIAGLGAFTLLAVFTFLAQYMGQSMTGFWRLMFQQFSIYDHLQTFFRGLVELNHVIFFLSTTAVFLFLTVKVLESRRWR